MMKKKNEATAMTLFNSPEFGDVRAMTINDEYWFVGKDVAEALGYENPQKAVRDHVDKEDKGVNKMFTPGGSQDAIIVNESGVYSLIFSSQLPSAKKFKHWVTSEVLPTLRKYGTYQMGEMMDQLNAMTAAIQELQAQMGEQKELLAGKIQPSYENYVKAFTEDQPITVIAKDYGWTARRLNEFLKDNGVQHKVPDCNAWLITDEYADKGFVTTETFKCRSYTNTTTKWTTAGRLFIYDLMKKAGYKPIMEQ